MGGTGDGKVDTWVAGTGVAREGATGEQLTSNKPIRDNNETVSRKVFFIGSIETYQPISAYFILKGELYAEVATLRVATVL